MHDFASRCLLAISLTLAGLLSAPGLVSAGVVANLSYDEEFEQNTNSFSGTNDWYTLYCSDSWRTDTSSGVAPRTDDGCTSNATGCGVGCTFGAGACNYTARNNLLVYTGKGWGDMRMDTTFVNSDDDTFGVTFRFSDGNHYYLFMASRSIIPNANNCDTELNSPASRLLVVYTDQQWWGTSVAAVTLAESN